MQSSVRDLAAVLCTVFFVAAAVADPGGPGGGQQVVECEYDTQGGSGGCTAATHQQKCDINNPVKICKGQRCLCAT